MKKLLLFIFIFLSFILVAVFFSSVPEQSDAEYVIELRKDGFYPKKLTIQKGDTIKFITTKGSYFWPASNLHPTHRIYEEFDPKEPVSAEESWNFRFNRVGNWKYHDHLAPYFTGEIEILD